MAVVCVGGVKGRPLPYCRNAPSCQSSVTQASTLLSDAFGVLYTTLALNRKGWSVAWIDLLELSGLKRSSRVDAIALDQVNVPFT